MLPSGGRRGLFSDLSFLVPSIKNLWVGGPGGPADERIGPVRNGLVCEDITGKSATIAILTL